MTTPWGDIKAQADRPDDTFVPPEDLRDELGYVIKQLEAVYQHGPDSDDPARLALLLADLRDVKQAASEAYSNVEGALIHAMGKERQVLVEGLGLVERKKVIRRKDWRNEALWLEVVGHARSDGREPHHVLAEVSRPSWRIEALRGIGIDPADYCLEEDQGWSLKLPSRDLDKRAGAW